MANTPSSNFSPTFGIPASGDDSLDVTDGPVMTAALNAHDHTTNKGLAVGRVTATMRVQEAEGADVVAASHLTLGTDGNFFWLTGGVTVDLIDATGWQKGSQITVFFGQATTVSHNTAVSGAFKPILLAASATYTFHTNSALTLRYVESSVWLEVSRANSLDAIVDVNATQTLLNKSLTTPTIAAATPTVAGEMGYGGGHLNVGDGAANHVLVDTDSVQTLTNKSIVVASYLQPNASYSRTGNQAIADSTMTTVVLNAVDWDTDTMTAGAGHLTCFTAGKYLITARLGQAAYGTGQLNVKILYGGANGGNFNADAVVPLASAGLFVQIGISVVYNLSVNDTVTLQAYQNSGGALNIGTQTTLQATRLSA